MSRPRAVIRSSRTGWFWGASGCPGPVRRSTATSPKPPCARSDYEAITQILSPIPYSQSGIRGLPSSKISVVFTDRGGTLGFVEHDEGEEPERVVIGVCLLRPRSDGSPVVPARICGDKA